MSHHLAISIDLDELVLDAHLFAPISFVLDGYHYFPDRKWVDFVAIILTWWVEQCRALVTAPVAEGYTFMFMDGPPFIHAKKISTTEAALTFSTPPPTLDTAQAVTVSLNDLKDSLIEVSQLVLFRAYENDWEHDTLDTLHRAVQALKKA